VLAKPIPDERGGFHGDARGAGAELLLEVCTSAHELVMLGLVGRELGVSVALHPFFFRLEMADDALDERIQLGPDSGASAFFLRELRVARGCHRPCLDARVHIRVCCAPVKRRDGLQFPP
jgi:hypothetical protein